MAPRTAAWLLPLLAAMAALPGCSGTPFGEQLSRSFSGSGSGSGGAGAGPTAKGQAAAGAPNPQPTAAPVKRMPTPPAAPVAAPLTPAPARAPATPASPPAPYRVTLKLPLADPSAPAEAVTQALRAAGVPFEVETIERVSGSGTSSPPAALAPTVTPAPAPR